MPSMSREGCNGQCYEINEGYLTFMKVSEAELSEPESQKQRVPILRLLANFKTVSANRQSL